MVVVGMPVAKSSGGQKRRSSRGQANDMRELADSFIQLLAIIMVMITLAVSTAAFSMMFG
jgi:hypothetical protein